MSPFGGEIQGRGMNKHRRTLQNAEGVYQAGRVKSLEDILAIIDTPARAIMQLRHQIKVERQALLNHLQEDGVGWAGAGALQVAAARDETGAFNVCVEGEYKIELPAWRKVFAVDTDPALPPYCNQFVWDVPASAPEETRKTIEVDQPIAICAMNIYAWFAGLSQELLETSMSPGYKSAGLWRAVVENGANLLTQARADQTTATPWIEEDPLRIFSPQLPQEHEHIHAMLGDLSQQKALTHVVWAGLLEHCITWATEESRSPRLRVTALVNLATQMAEAAGDQLRVIAQTVWTSRGIERGAPIYWKAVEVGVTAGI